MKSLKSKVIVVGSSGVGKTALIHQLETGTFRSENQPTIGVDFKTYTVKEGDSSVVLHIWDTAGQERFRSIAKAYFRGALGALLVFDLTNHTSFSDLDGWLSDLHALSSAHVLLVANKCDLDTKRKVSDEEIRKFAELNGLEYIETSATKNVNVFEAFEKLTNMMVRHIELPPPPPDTHSRCMF